MKSLELRKSINRELEHFPTKLLEEVSDFIGYIKVKKLKKNKTLSQLEKIKIYNNLNPKAKKEAYKIVKAVEDGLSDVKKGKTYPIEKLWEKLND